MLDTILNLIGDLKTCLAVAVGSGFFLGYIYTKLKARELFKPEVNALNQKLDLKKEKLQDLLELNQKVELDLGKDAEILNKQNLELSNLKSKLKEEEQNRLLLESKKEEKKGLYQREETVLKNRQEDIHSLKETLGVEDIAKITEHKHTLEKSVQNLQQAYNVKSDSILGLTKEKNALTNEISSLKDKIHSLDAKVNKKEFELTDVNKKVATIRDKFQVEFDTLVSEKNSYEAKIERYKRQLLDIQKTL